MKLIVIILIMFTISTFAKSENLCKKFDNMDVSLDVKQLLQRGKNLYDISGFEGQDQFVIDISSSDKFQSFNIHEALLISELAPSFNEVREYFLIRFAQINKSRLSNNELKCLASVVNSRISIEAIEMEMK